MASQIRLPVDHRCGGHTAQVAHVAFVARLNYPSIERGEIERGGSRAGAHSDYGTVTLLFQDSVGGLEVQNKHGEFVPARPVPDTVRLPLAPPRSIS